jgi:RHS repeat-associated protein
VTAQNRYDEYGNPAATNEGRFQYTGQKWLPGLGLYDYKARMYDPRLGRFLQPDPIGYGDGMNMYAYVGGDPVNLVDPLGLCVIVAGSEDQCGDIFVTGRRRRGAHPASVGAVRESSPPMLLPYDGPQLQGDPGGMRGRCMQRYGEPWHAR